MSRFIFVWKLSARFPCLTWSLIDTNDVSQPIDIVKQFTQSVDQLSLRMDSGGWVLVTEFASKLGISIQELITRARHYPSERIEFTVWKEFLGYRGCTSPRHPCDPRTHLSLDQGRQVRFVATLMKFHTHCDLHVYIRPLFLDGVVLRGIATRQHQGYERMSITLFLHTSFSPMPG